MSRTELRQHVFKLLFRIEFNSPEDMSKQVELYFDDLESVSKEDKAYILGKYEAIMDKLSEIDDLLNELSSGWKTSRMNRVDLTILRLAVYEIRYDDSIPTGVAINEAVEIAKKFSSDSGPAFVNGVLAKVAN